MAFTNEQMERYSRHIILQEVGVKSATGAAVVSCKTAQDIPKGKIFEIVVALRQVTAHAPVKIGDVLLSNAAGTGVDIIATKNVQ